MPRLRHSLIVGLSIAAAFSLVTIPFMLFGIFLTDSNQGVGLTRQLVVESYSAARLAEQNGSFPTAKKLRHYIETLDSHPKVKIAAPYSSLIRNFLPATVIIERADNQRLVLLGRHDSGQGIVRLVGNAHGQYTTRTLYIGKFNHRLAIELSLGIPLILFLVFFLSALLARQSGPAQAGQEGEDDPLGTEPDEDQLPSAVAVGPRSRASGLAERTA